ncbi:MAG: DNA-3-methyladenine glycosylase I [Chloroflexi bacterium]|nr:DNA-3-methyladenine glycosylase I [Chloroflexota bacterium]MDA1219879.1 DNA-3-methyladenine glycosylase I [Chloroflexota bacterium]
MQAPARIQPQRLNDYLDVMSKSVFQSGLSWKVVESKWPSTQEALQQFDPKVVAALTDDDLDELTQDTRVIRSRRKLNAVVHNARRMLELEHEHGGFQNYLRSHGDFENALKDIKKQFKYLGDAGTFHFLWVVGEDVPDYEEWCQTHH